MLPSRSTTANSAPLPARTRGSPHGYRMNSVHGARGRVADANPHVPAGVLDVVGLGVGDARCGPGDRRRCRSAGRTASSSRGACRPGRTAGCGCSRGRRRTARPRESIAIACSARNSPGASPVRPHALTNLPSFANFTTRLFVASPWPSAHEDVAVRRDDDVARRVEVRAVVARQRPACRAAAALCRSG